MLSFAVLSACSSSSTSGGADGGTGAPDGAADVDSGTGSNDSGARDGASDATVSSDGGDSGSDAGPSDAGRDATPSDGGMDAATSDAGPSDSGGDATSSDGGMDAAPADSGSDAGALSDAAGDGASDGGGESDPGAAYTIFVGGGNTLVRFLVANPGSITSFPVMGLGANETLVSLDFRPSNRKLYALTALDVSSDAGATTTSLRLYTVALATGLATPLGAGVDVGVLLPYGVVDIDFDPVVDRLRVVAASRSFRIHPDTGALVARDTDVQPRTEFPFSGSAPRFGAVAYDRTTFDGMTPAATTLFALENNNKQLMTLGGPNGTPSPNGGETSLVGPNNLPAPGSPVGFDISADGTAWAIFLTQPQGIGDETSRFASVDLATGNATGFTEIGSSLRMLGLAVAP